MVQSVINAMNDSRSQLLEAALKLKSSIETNGAVNNSNFQYREDALWSGDIVTKLTELQSTYRKLLITNLEFALDNKVDHDLWGVFKSRISLMQQVVRETPSRKRAEAQIHLTSFLDSASGFYSNLLQDLCHVYNVDIPGTRLRACDLNILKDNIYKTKKSTVEPVQNSSHYICQHCLVHLGDIARYRQQNAHAESYYLHAARFMPSSGHPYNQLAILATAKSDLLKMAFYYCRSMAVKGKFPGSHANLKRSLSKIITSKDPVNMKITSSDLVKFFLKFHACIYLKQNINKLKDMVGQLCFLTLVHLKAGSLCSSQIIQMTFINLFTLQHLAERGIKDGMPVQSASDHNDDVVGVGNTLTSCWEAMLHFAMSCLGEFLSCVPIHSDDINELKHPVLPAIKLVLDWLVVNPSLLMRADFSSYSKVWPRLAKLLNTLGNQDKVNDNGGAALPEDVEVRGFVGLLSCLRKLNFDKAIIGNHHNDVTISDCQHACRCYRLYKLGLKISEINVELLRTTIDNNSTFFHSDITAANGADVNNQPGTNGFGDQEVLLEDIFSNNSAASPSVQNTRVVTFANQPPTQFSPSPYSIERSPSPNSTTSSSQLNNQQNFHLQQDNLQEHPASAFMRNHPPPKVFPDFNRPPPPPSFPPHDIGLVPPPSINKFVPPPQFGSEKATIYPAAGGLQMPQFVKRQEFSNQNAVERNDLMTYIEQMKRPQPTGGFDPRVPPPQWPPRSNVPPPAINRNLMELVQNTRRMETPPLNHYDVMQKQGDLGNRQFNLAASNQLKQFYSSSNMNNFHTGSSFSSTNNIGQPSSSNLSMHSMDKYKEPSRSYMSSDTSLSSIFNNGEAMKQGGNYQKLQENKSNNLLAAGDDAYKLFPDNNIWGPKVNGASSNNSSNTLLTPIGSERFKESSNSNLQHHFSPWSNMNFVKNDSSSHNPVPSNSQSCWPPVLNHQGNVDAPP